ncbi:MAG TPA: alanine/ornithine racemase family PLP-dependent enzyme [Thermoanaerobaculia bacterium]|nr:alanine/ornithine racemase family PLP-dependent enzyme [Thermoanaerobaculia bacterium]
MLRLTIDLGKLLHNVRQVRALYARRGVEVTGVTKAVLGMPEIARTFVRGGLATLADSRLENLARLRAAGIAARFVLLRTPPSRAAEVVRLADVSLNTELETLRALSAASVAAGRRHGIILMIELGDLREGVPVADAPRLFAAAIELPGLDLLGIGCNLACYGGVAPDDGNMAALSQLADDLEKRFDRRLPVISGGNSANHRWLTTTAQPSRVNNLRLGELLLLGRETLERHAVPGLHTDAFTLTAEVIEANVKPTVPRGTICQDAFGKVPVFVDRGELPRVIVALGRQDTWVPGLEPRGDLAILGSSSDHVILDASRLPPGSLEVGDEVAFDLDYAALLAAMTSPFVRQEIAP